MQGNILGWISIPILSCFVISFFSLGIFMRIEKNHPTPFVDLSLLKNGCISRCVLITACLQVAYMSIIFWAIFLQEALFLSPQKTGVCLLAAQIPILLFSSIAGRTLDRFGPRMPATFGTLMITISCIWLAIFAWQHNFFWLLPALILFGVGSPFSSLCMMSTAIAASPPEKRGVVSGLVSGARQMGGSMGLAILTAGMSNLTTHHLSQSAHVGHGQAETLTGHAVTADAYTLGFSSIMLLAALFSFVSFLAARRLPNTPRIE
jgi:predicted MFS family arabinose efflux permease